MRCGRSPSPSFSGSGRIPRFFSQVTLEHVLCRLHDQVFPCLPLEGREVQSSAISGEFFLLFGCGHFVLGLRVDSSPFLAIQPSLANGLLISSPCSHTGEFLFFLPYGKTIPLLSFYPSPLLKDAERSSTLFVYLPMHSQNALLADFSEASPISSPLGIVSGQWRFGLCCVRDLLLPSPFSRFFRRRENLRSLCVFGRSSVFFFMGRQSS